MTTMINKGILGTKVGMTRVFQENGDAVACTLVEAGPCVVVQRKTTANDGYEAIQIGFEPRREKLVEQAPARPLRQGRCGARPLPPRDPHHRRRRRRARGRQQDHV